MFKYSAGFVGAGHMGSILARIAVGVAGGERIAVACSTAEHSGTAAEKLGCNRDSAEGIIAGSELIFLGFRPMQLDVISETHRQAIEDAQGTFVSMLAGVSIGTLEEKLGRDKRVIRIMPNTPCEIGKGLIGYACNKNVDALQIEQFKALLAPAGLIEELPESKIDIFSVIAACAPAYTYFFADALANGGEECGIDKEKAIRYIAQMLAGSAGMMMKGDKTPESLKNEVCTPGGTTIEGVNRLTEGGFETLVAEAVKSSYNKTVEKK